MNEVYEAMANFLEELRCETEERDYVISTEDLKAAESDLKKIQKKWDRYLEQIPTADQEMLDEYVETLEHLHFKEEQRAYYQGMMDCIQILGGLGLIKNGKNTRSIIEKLKQ